MKEFIPQSVQFVVCVELLSSSSADNWQQQITPRFCQGLEATWNVPISLFHYSNIADKIKFNFFSSSFLLRKIPLLKTKQWANEHKRLLSVDVFSPTCFCFLSFLPRDDVNCSNIYCTNVSKARRKRRSLSGMWAKWGWNLWMELCFRFNE